MFNKILEKYKGMSLPVKAALWYTICNFLNKGIALLTMPIFTRLLTEEQYGIYSIYQSWTNILIIFSSLNIFMSSYIKGLIKYKDDQENFTTSQIGLILMITMLIGTICFFNINLVEKILNIPKLLIFGMFIELLSMPILELWLARERFDYKYKSIIFVTIGLNILSILVSIITIVLTNYKIEAKVFSNAFIRFIFIMPLFYFFIKKSKKFFDWNYWKYALVFNLPLIPHYLSNFVLTQSDRIMIGRYVGNSEAAFYSIAYTISTVLVLLITATNNALTPYIYKSLEKKEIEGIKKNTNQIIIIMAVLVLIVMIFAPEIIYVFAGKNYMDAIYVIPPITASVFFIYIYSLFSNVEYYYQRTFLIAMATSICAVLNIVLNYFFINKFGYYAAGYTTLICYLFLSLFHFCAYKIVLRKEMPNVKNLYDIKLIVSISIFILVYMFFMLLTYRYILLKYLLFIVIVIFAILFRKVIINVVKSSLKSNKE